jgi:hypothetical protein
VGVSRVRVSIDRVVLNGFPQLEGRALVEALQSQLSDVLRDSTGRRDWARPHRTPVLRLGSMALHPGTAGARTFGRSMALAVGRGLKP